MALPANISTGTVSGVFLRAKPDGLDVDRAPDGEGIRGLKVTFTPSISPALVKDLSATPPVTILIDPVSCTTDDNGVLCGPDGQPGVLLVASSDADISPSDWTWTVEIKQSSTFPRVSFSFVVAPDSTIDLSTVLPVPAGLGADLVLWQQAVADTLAAKVAAQTAQTAAETAAASVPTTAQLNATFVAFENVKKHGATGDGTSDDTAAIQAAIDAVMAAGGGTIFFPRGRYRASGLVGEGVLAFRGAGGGDPRGGTRVTDRAGSVLMPFAAGSPVITLAYTVRLKWEIDFVHDRSFKADALILGDGTASGRGTFWPDLDFVASGFDGHGLKIVGTLWECNLKNVHTRRCGDGTADKAAVEIDGTTVGQDGDTVRFSAPNVTFPRAVGFRMRSSSNSASTTGPGFRRLVLAGGMFHAGLDEDNVGGTNRYDADMIVIDGFTSLDVRGVNVASVADNRFALRLAGTLTTNGSSRARVEGNQFNGPIFVGKCKDVTIGRNDWAFFSSVAYPEHVFVDALAVRTIIEPQTVVNDGSLVVTNNSTTTAQPTGETVLVPASEFVSSTGAPTLGRIGSRFPAWLLDAAATEQVNASVTIPNGWRRFHVEMLWSNLGPSVGDVRWSLGYSAMIVGGVLSSGDTFFAASTDTAPATDVLAVKTWTSTAIVASKDALYHFRLSRVGGDAADTLPNDAAFLGLRLRRAA